MNLWVSPAGTFFFFLKHHSFSLLCLPKFKGPGCLLQPGFSLTIMTSELEQLLSPKMSLMLASPFCKQGLSVGQSKVQRSSSSQTSLLHFNKGNRNTCLMLFQPNEAFSKRLASMSSLSLFQLPSCQKSRGQECTLHFLLVVKRLVEHAHDDIILFLTLFCSLIRYFRCSIFRVRNIHHKPIFGLKPCCHIDMPVLKYSFQYSL